MGGSRLFRVGASNQSLARCILLFLRSVSPLDTFSVESLRSQNLESSSIQRCHPPKLHSWRVRPAAKLLIPMFSVLACFPRRSCHALGCLWVWWPSGAGVTMGKPIWQEPGQAQNKTPQKPLLEHVTLLASTLDSTVCWVLIIGIRVIFFLNIRSHGTATVQQGKMKLCVCAHTHTLLTLTHTLTHTGSMSQPLFWLLLCYFQLENGILFSVNCVNDNACALQKWHPSHCMRCKAGRRNDENEEGVTPVSTNPGGGRLEISVHRNN